MRIRLAHCMAHARRKLFEIGNTGHDPIAGRGLELIARLYAVEKEIRGRKPDERLAARRKASQPIAGELEKWIAESQPRVPAKSPIGKALACFAHHWEGPALFLGDGRIEIDNNSLGGPSGQWLRPARTPCSPATRAPRVTGPSSHR